MEKLDKKVSWSENLTDVKVISTQPSMYEHLTDISEDPEEEEEPCTDSETNLCNKSSKTLMDSPKTPN